MSIHATFQQLGLAYLRVLRGILTVAAATGLFIVVGVLIVFPLWYLATELPGLYSILVPFLCIGGALIFMLRRIRNRRNELRDDALARIRRAQRLRVTGGFACALLSLYFLAAAILSATPTALVPAIISAGLAGVLSLNRGHVAREPKDRVS